MVKTGRAERLVLPRRQSNVARPFPMGPLSSLKPQILLGIADRDAHDKDLQGA